MFTYCVVSQPGVVTREFNFSNCKKEEEVEVEVWNRECYSERVKLFHMCEYMEIIRGS